jgi:hypothetical protein
MKYAFQQALASSCGGNGPQTDKWKSCGPAADSTGMRQTCHDFDGALIVPGFEDAPLGGRGADYGRARGGCRTSAGVFRFSGDDKSVSPFVWWRKDQGNFLPRHHRFHAFNDIDKNASCPRACFDEVRVRMGAVGDQRGCQNNHPAGDHGVAIEGNGNGHLITDVFANDCQ